VNIFLFVRLYMYIFGRYSDIQIKGIMGGNGYAAGSQARPGNASDNSVSHNAREIPVLAILSSICPHGGFWESSAFTSSRYNREKRPDYQ